MQFAIIACQEKFLSQLIETHIVYLESCLKQAVRSDGIKLRWMKIQQEDWTLSVTDSHDVALSVCLNFEDGIFVNSLSSDKLEARLLKSKESYDTICKTDNDHSPCVSFGKWQPLDTGGFCLCRESLGVKHPLVAVIEKPDFPIKTCGNTAVC